MRQLRVGVNQFLPVQCQTSFIPSGASLTDISDKHLSIFLIDLSFFQSIAICYKKKQITYRRRSDYYLSSAFRAQLERPNDTYVSDFRSRRLPFIHLESAWIGGGSPLQPPIDASRPHTPDFLSARRRSYPAANTAASSICEVGRTATASSFKKHTKEHGLNRYMTKYLQSTIEKLLLRPRLRREFKHDMSENRYAGRNSAFGSNFHGSDVPFRPNHGSTSEDPAR
ncbi:uncharacterized protein RCO7_14358 [Rhynchosporium graminicola]|uniref:Uncharacterized protein n=1 Tax=Rhynchosporium graminicola TaxID=2792576 RepID=A0A1E1KB28_9HELO|nr:uncharacterized protein RCO7_14358 [Rhynchosporium commune]